MDRLDRQSVPFAALDEPTSGWDSHAVWRERIHAPRQPVRKTAPAIASLLDASTGWDPMETWRVRVQRSRPAQG